MNEDKIMSAEAFNELIDGFEIVGSLTEYGRRNVKYHVKKLQEENQQLKDVIDKAIKNMPIKTILDIANFEKIEPNNLFEAMLEYQEKRDK